MCVRRSTRRLQKGSDKTDKNFFQWSPDYERDYDTAVKGLEDWDAFFIEDTPQRPCLSDHSTFAPCSSTAQPCREGDLHITVVIMDSVCRTVEKPAWHDWNFRRKQTDKSHERACDTSTQPAGNLATQRWLRSGVIRPQLAVSQPGDSYEQEADRIADHIMRMPEPGLHRNCASCESGAMCSSCKDKNSFLQRKAGQENSLPTNNHSAADFVSGLGAGRPLDTAVRAFFETRLGADLTNVRVHADNQAAESAQSINALAYTLGRDLVFAHEQYAPETTEGRRLIAHELAHVLQQQEGLIQRYETGQRGFTAGSCAGWEQDPESFSIHVARHFVATQVNPALAGKPRSVTCESDHDCKVTFGDDLIVDVYWYKDTRRVGAGRWTDQGRQFCAFDYSCDSSGQMILSVVKCYGTPKP